MGIDEYWGMKRVRADRHKQLAKSGADEMYDKFLEFWMERIEEKKYLEMDLLQAGAVQKMQEWKSSGLRLSLVTMRNNRENLFWQLTTLGLLPLFDDVIIVGNSEGDGSGKADAVRTLTLETGSDALLWIGDTEVDIKAARLAGVRICAVSCGLRTADYLATLKPDFIVPDLNAVNFSKMRLL